jgi:hypothetical protein
LTKTFGLPVTLESVTGPYLAVKNPEAGQRLEPDDFVNFCAEKLTVLPVFDAAPETPEAVKVHVIEPTIVSSTIVVFSGFVADVPLIFTGSPFASLIVPLYGRLLIVTLVTLVTPVMLLVHLLKLCAVIDSFAVPGLAGFAVTFALKLDVEHLMPVVLVAVSKKFAVVPLARLAFRTAPVATLVPPTFPVVRTSIVAAEAGTVASAVKAAVAATAASTR